MVKQVTTSQNYVLEVCFLPNKNVVDPRPLVLLLGLCKVEPVGDSKASSARLQVIGFAFDSHTPTWALRFICLGSMPNPPLQDPAQLNFEEIINVVDPNEPIVKKAK